MEVRVCQLESLPMGASAHVIEGTPLLLVRSEDALRAVSAICPHAGASLVDGFIEEDAVICPLHGWVFSLKDGSCAVHGYELNTYGVEVREDGVFVVLNADTGVLPDGR